MAWLSTREPRVALGRAIAHNAAVPRHGARPLRDTTHCQAFCGTAPMTRGDEAIFRAPALDAGWLAFSRGDVPGELPCELLRSPLRLPACPERARKEGDSYVFVGRGERHVEGLDVERARRSRAEAQDILRGAYGEPSSAADLAHIARLARPGRDLAHDARVCNFG